MPAFPYVIVRYESGIPGAVILFYARSFEQASDVLRTLVPLQWCYDATAIYAIRETVECYEAPSVYHCVCGGSVGGC